MIKYALRDLIKVGNLYKTVGVNGDLILDLFDGFEGKEQEIKYFFVANNGQSLPFFIDNIRNSSQQTLIRFEGVDSPESATAIANQSIYLDAEMLRSLDVKIEKSLEALEGFKLYNNDELIGQILYLEEYPSQNVLVVEGLDNVIPLVEDWILEVDTEEKTLRMSFDDEILRLND